MSYVERVRTTVCLNPPERPEEIALQPKTLIVGPTGSGKTRIATSLALLLTGAADDVLGREHVAAPADLILLAPPDRDLEVHGWWSNHATAGLTVGRKGDGEGTTNRKWNGGPTNSNEWAHPVRKVGELLAKSATEARKGFLPFIVGDVAGVLVRMLPHQYQRENDPRAMALTSVDDLVKALETAKVRTREEHNKIGAQTDLADRLAGALETPPSDTDRQMANASVEAARRALATAQEGLRALRDQANALGAKRARLAQIAGVAENVRAQWTRTEQVLAENDAVPAPQGVEFLPMFEAASTLLTEATRMNLAQCPMCLSQVGAEHLAKRQSAVNTLVANTTAASASYVAAQRAVKSAHYERGELQRRFTELQTEHESLTAELATMTATDPDALAARTRAVEEAEQVHQGAVAVQQRADALSNQWTSVNRAREIITQAEQERTWWAGYLDALERARDKLLEEGRATFEGRIQKWLPKGLTVRLALQTGEGKDTFRLGLVDNGRMLLNPSGGQRAALLLALACACYDFLPETVQEFGILLLDEERGMDPEFLAATMRALKDAPFQIVLTSLHRPKGKVAGWTVIEPNGTGATAKSKGGVDKPGNDDDDQNTLTPDGTSDGTSGGTPPAEA